MKQQWPTIGVGQCGTDDDDDYHDADVEYAAYDEGDIDNDDVERIKAILPR